MTSLRLRTMLFVSDGPYEDQITNEGSPIHLAHGQPLVQVVCYSFSSSPPSFPLPHLHPPRLCSFFLPPPSSPSSSSSSSFILLKQRYGWPRVTFHTVAWILKAPEKKRACGVSTPPHFTFKSFELLWGGKGLILSGKEAIGERSWGEVTKRT